CRVSLPACLQWQHEPADPRLRSPNRRGRHFLLFPVRMNVATVPISEILLAGPRGFCAGVERAIDIVELALSVCRPPVYVRREVVHNRHVVERLRAKGAVFVDELAGVPRGATVLLRAPGTAPAEREDPLRGRLRVTRPTCPRVTRN